MNQTLHLRRTAAAALLALCCMPACPAAAQAKAPPTLGETVRGVLADKLLRNATAGVAVVRLSDGEPILRMGADQPLIPASNLKLITTAAAIDALGADFRFRTFLYRKGNDLVIVGDGDPTLGDAELLKPHGWGTTTTFDRWAAALQQRLGPGVTVGDVIVDDSVFDDRFVHPNWPADQLHLRYVAGVGGLNLNANCIDFMIRFRGIGQTVDYATDPPSTYLPVQNTCTGSRENAVWLSRDPMVRAILLKGTSPGTTAPISVTVDDPGLYAATVLKEALARAGITVTGTVRRDRTTGLRGVASPPRGVALVAAHETPLQAVLHRANKDSMNLYAECLLKRTAVARTGQSGSWEAGIAEMGAFLEKCGVPRSQFTLDDGCGLSRGNAVSADAVTRVLARMHASPHRSIYADSLAVAGIDGTLDDRFKGSDLRGRVFAKSGFIRGVSCLSGYLKTPGDDWYAFSILFNGIPEKSNSSIKPLQERIVQAIDRTVAK